MALGPKCTGLLQCGVGECKPQSINNLKVDDLGAAGRTSKAFQEPYENPNSYYWNNLNKQVSTSTKTPTNANAIQFRENCLASAKLEREKARKLAQEKESQKLSTKINNLVNNRTFQISCYAAIYIAAAIIIIVIAACTLGPLGAVLKNSIERT